MSYTSLWSQSAVPKLLLQSGIRTLPANADAYIRQPQLDPSEQGAGYYVRLIQFEDVLSPLQRQAVEATGVELLQYIPHQAYLAQFPSQMDVRQLQGLGLRSIVPLQPIDKMEPDLAQGNYPAHAWTGASIGVECLYLPKTPASAVEKAIRSIGGSIVSHSPQGRQVQANMPPDRLTELAGLPFVLYVAFVPPPAKPEDLRSVSLQRANTINGQYAGAYRYDGTGVHVAVRDDGDIGPHIDFQGRLSQQFASPGGGDHGDQVAGTLGGYGNRDPLVQGMAPGAFVYGMNYVANFLDSTIFLHTQRQVVITNSSYSNGCNAGYTLTTYNVDVQGFIYPSLLHVFSAGNENGTDCGYGAGTQWGNITGGHKIGKNVVAVAALTTDDVVASYSSRGPARDGRIKPELAAMGSSVRMTGPDHTYLQASGTSFAAPALAGVAAQLYHAYRDLQGKEAQAGLIKAIMMNSADDLGNPGPDFSYGYGRVHAWRALKVIEQQQYLEGQIGHGETRQHSIVVPAGVKEVRVMTYWTDLPAWPLARKALINDLDTRVADPGGSSHLPYVLSINPAPADLGTPAAMGIDTLNNIEQVAIFDPTAGTYTLTVEGSQVPEGPQKYVVVYTFLYDEVRLTYPFGGESLVPGTTTRIRWDAYGASASYQVEFSSDSGQTWAIIASAVPATQKHLDWIVPNVVSSRARIRITRSGQSDTGMAPFHIMGQPQNLAVTQVCPNTTRLQWDAVPGATDYDIFVLGDKYMDSITSLGLAPANPSILVPIDENEDHWLAVRARGQGGVVGIRSLAIFRPAGRVNCQVTDDIQVLTAYPTAQQPLQTCRPIVSPIVVEFRNLAAIGLNNIPLVYQLDNGTPVQTTFSGFAASNQTQVFTFPTPAVLIGQDSFLLKVWSAYPSDAYTSNDTIETVIRLVGGAAYPLPYLQDFETAARCGTTSNCGLEVCPLEDGWINLPNGVDDDIDWRVHRGPTPTANTGPQTDHRPGTATGQYLYLETSGSCDGQSALLVSPCIDLTTAIAPELSFWYHMLGTDIGELHLDINFAGVWVQDIMPVIQGQQGSNWIEARINLTPYAGNVITLRLRAMTETGFLGDMALDDIAIYDRAAPPIADFEADARLLCIGQSLLLSDRSVNSPSGFVWNFEPPLATYLNGTDSSMAAPVVRFDLPGLYAVSLVATNAFGSDTLLRQQYVQVTPGTAPDVVEGFEGSYPPAEWSLNNPDNQDTWTPIATMGTAGLVTTAAYVNHFVYNAQIAEDHLRTLRVNLTGSDQPMLYFDVAYARYNNSSADGLRVSASTTCGTPFPIIIYNKAGNALATAPNQLTAWTPQSPVDWRRDSVDLSSFVGKVVILQFTSINDNGNNLYLDNIQLVERGNAAPVADFDLSAQVLCERELLAIAPVISGGSATDYTWDFGTDAQPATATGPGPHSVAYTSPGVKLITLTAGNPSGSTSMTRFLQVDPLANTGFDYTWAGGTYTFTSTTTGADSLRWDFGDGATSTDTAPSHTYNTNGSYTVRLIAFNACGADTLTAELGVSTVGIDVGYAVSARIFPNPSTGVFDLEIEASQLLPWQGEVLDLQGRLLLRLDLPQQARFRRSLDLRQYSQGTYLLHLYALGWTQTIRFTIE
ncbi:MAG: hypothetical protein OHK0039_12370 [Bacteroidia bacterium]